MLTFDGSSSSSEAEKGLPEKTLESRNPKFLPILSGRENPGFAKTSPKSLPEKEKPIITSPKSSPIEERT
jgi:hypothetical protein